MKKFPLLIIALIIILIILLFLAYIAKDTVPMVIFLKDGDIIPDNICKNLDDIMFMVQTGCPACAATQPRIEKLEKELNFKTKYYDLSKKEDRDELISKFILPHHIPTLVKNCKVYVGALSEEKLKEILK